ncbi:hypothetical protein BJF78_22725 [Pseudonocardia sp. CNS-139]|nr:hypothetical protein BJF78_22725 [Pseudonocardia sp. CNS-139]
MSGTNKPWPVLDESEAPPEIDVTVPSVARMYDYILGGRDNYAVDREAVEGLMRENPGAQALAVDNRAFMRRAVRFLVEVAGIRQFVDIGSGLPTRQNVHQIAHSVDPGARVVYVDNDPIVLAHGRALLADNATTTVIDADAADPAAIFDNPETRKFIDVDRPYAVVMVGLLHWIPDADDPAGTVAYIRHLMPSGSYLAATNLLADDDPRADGVEKSLTSRVGGGFFRPWEKHREYFEGLRLVEPGLVYANDWRPDRWPSSDDSYATLLTGGVGRKP